MSHHPVQAITMSEIEGKTESAIESEDSPKPIGWWGAGQDRPAGFGGTINAGTWAAKWQHTPTRAIRVPDCAADLLIELARAADQQDDPIAWLQSLRPAQDAAAIEEGEWDGYNVAQLRQAARERGLKTARNANRAELLEFLGATSK